MHTPVLHRYVSAWHLTSRTMVSSHQMNGLQRSRSESDSAVRAQPPMAHQPPRHGKSSAGVPVYLAGRLVKIVPPKPPQLPVHQSKTPLVSYSVLVEVNRSHSHVIHLQSFLSQRDGVNRQFPVLRSQSSPRAAMHNPFLIRIALQHSQLMDTLPCATSMTKHNQKRALFSVSVPLVFPYSPLM